MAQQAYGVQDAVKAACSISYLSEKLGVSRPTLYKYMDQYDSGFADRVPSGVRDFFKYVTASPRTGEDVILYFMNRPSQGRTGAERIGVKYASDGGRGMIMFPEAGDDAVVRVYVDMDGDRECIGEYRPAQGQRFVTLDNIVCGQTFYFEVLSQGRSSGQVPFEIQR